MIPMRLPALLVTLLTLPAHPLHTTHTTIVVTSGNRMTVEIRAFTDDLHAAATRLGGAGGDSALARYVRATVTLTDAAGRPVGLVWEEARLDGDVTLMRLHGVMPGGVAGAALRQAMHTEVFPDQVNVVQIRYPARRLSFLFTPGDRAKRLP